jgi:MFS family permease
MNRVAIPRTVWVLGFVSLLMDVSSEMIHGLLPVFMISVLGSSAFAVGLIEGVAEATANITKVFSGALSDRWRRRKSLAVFGYGLAAATKPLFALAGGTGMVLGARFIDRIGKGIRVAPRDALIADVTDPAQRGAAFGLRQSLDTVGAFAGPLAAIGLMVLFDDDFRRVFWIAVLPAWACVALLALGVDEPVPVTRAAPAHAVADPMGRAYWQVLILGVIFTLARFSEAFLILRANGLGLADALSPLVLVVMNLTYSVCAYPVGRLSDRIGRRGLLVAGLAVLVAADLVLARSTGLVACAIGIVLWGLHMGLTQGLLAALIADTAPATRRGHGFGLFNFASGIALLVASALAGLLWERVGPAETFYAGALFAALALLASLRLQSRSS